MAKNNEQRPAVNALVKACRALITALVNQRFLTGGISELTLSLSVEISGLIREHVERRVAFVALAALTVGDEEEILRNLHEWLLGDSERLVEDVNDLANAVVFDDRGQPDIASQYARLVDAALVLAKVTFADWAKKDQAIRPWKAKYDTWAARQPN